MTPRCSFAMLPSPIQVDFAKRVAVVFGSEQLGVSSELLRHCDGERERERERARAHPDHTYTSPKQ